MDVVILVINIWKLLDNMAWSPYQIGIVVLMVTTGTLNTISAG